MHTFQTISRKRKLFFHSFQHIAHLSWKWDQNGRGADQNVCISFVGTEPKYFLSIRFRRIFSLFKKNIFFLNVKTFFWNFSCQNIYFLNSFMGGELFFLKKNRLKIAWNVCSKNILEFCYCSKNIFEQFFKKNIFFTIYFCLKIVWNVC